MSSTWNVLMSGSAGATRASGAGGASGRGGARAGEGAGKGAGCGTGMFCALLREMAVQLTSLRAQPSRQAALPSGSHVFASSRASRRPPGIPSWQAQPTVR